MIRINTRFWFIFSIFLFAIVTWSIYDDDIFLRITFLAVLMLVISFVWAYISTLGVDVERRAKISRQNVGDYFEEHFIIINKLPIRHFNLHVKDYSPLDGQFNSRVISYLGTKQIRTYNTFTFLKERGATLLGPTVLESCDPLYLFLSRKENKKNKSLLVYPYMVELTRFPEPPGLLTGGKSLKKPTVDTTPHAAGIREYSQGDPLQRIHWPSTLRKNRYMVKEFDQDPQSSIWIILDSYINNHHKEEMITSETKNTIEWAIRKKNNYHLPRDTYEYAITISASVANYYINQGRSTGFSTACKTLSHISAEKGHRQLTKILETLAFLKSDGDLPILGLIQAETKNLSKGTTIIIITTTVESQTELCAESIRQRGLTPIFIIIESNTFTENKKIKSNEEILMNIKSPTIRIKYGDDIKKVMESI